MAQQKITFTGALGEPLDARLDTPDSGIIRGYVLFAHCFTCGKDLSTINRLARALGKEDIALFRFDFTGLGLSNGDFANTNFSSNVQDLLAAAAFMRQELAPPAIMMGHSLGGTATLVAAGQVPEVQGVATIGAPADTEHVLHHFADQMETIEQQGEAEVSLVGRPFRVRRHFLEDARAQNVSAAIAGLRRPLLIMHSPRDETVGIDNARVIYEAAKHPKSFISLDQADHLLMNDPKDSRYVARVLSAWASWHL